MGSQTSLTEREQANKERAEELVETYEKSALQGEHRLGALVAQLLDEVTARQAVDALTTEQAARLVTENARLSAELARSRVVERAHEVEREDLLETIRALLPYAETRAEDLAEQAEAAARDADERCDEPSGEARKADQAMQSAWAVIERARALVQPRMPAAAPAAPLDLNAGVEPDIKF